MSTKTQTTRPLYASMTRVYPGSFPWPVAFICAGSVIIDKRWGITRAHAVKRATRWLKHNTI